MKEMGREGGQAEKFDRIQVFMGVFFLSFQLFDLEIIKNSNKERRRGSGRRGGGRKESYTANRRDDPNRKPQ